MTEEQIQGQCVTWWRTQHKKNAMLLFSSLNGIKLPGGEKQGARLKRAGMTAGVADLFLSIPSGNLCGLYIEMKTAKGRQQKNQKEFESKVIEKGYGYVMPKSLDEFIRVVNRYLETGEY